MSTSTPVTLTGVFLTPDGAAFPNKALIWRRFDRAVTAVPGSVIAPESITVTTNGSGAISASFLPGRYQVDVAVDSRTVRFFVPVPESDVAIDVSSLIGTSAPPDFAAATLAQQYAGEASTSADLSEAWAAGTEPGGPGTKSSREYSEDAEASAARVDLGALDDAVTAAQTAQGLSEVAQTGAEAAETGAQTAQGLSEVAQAASEAARDAAEDAVQYDYLVDDGTALAALAGMVTNERAYVRETEHVWKYNGSVWVDEGLSVTSSKADKTQITELQRQTARYLGSDDIVPLYTDAGGRVLLGVSQTTGDLSGANIGDVGVERLLGAGGAARYSGSGPVWPFFTDAGGRVLLGYNTTTGEVVGALSSASAASTSFPVETLDAPIVTAAYNHILGYGQSLSVGAAAGSVLSTSQPYSNVTFAGGPRAWDGSDWDFGTYKPLVEDAVSPAPDGSTGRQETMCSGAANYASSLLAQAGTDPADHVILASTAGHGGYRVDQLESGTAWYANLEAHVAGAQTLNTDHAVHAVMWLQGENDINVTNYATYRAGLEQLQADFEADVQTATSQAHPVYFITYQVSWGAQLDPDIALAQLDLAQNSDKFFLSSPTYHMPHAADNVHLLAAGYKWLGAYFGRAYSEIVQGRKPRWLNPVSATRRGAVVRVRFQVPQLPLVLDTDTLATTTDYGFVVTDGGVADTINSIEIDGSDVVITLDGTPAGACVVRYAIDNIGTGLTITNGGSGNLRDSTPDVIEVSGTDRPLYHVSPAFQLTAIALSE